MLPPAFAHRRLFARHRIGITRQLALLLHDSGKLSESERLFRHVIERVKGVLAGPREQLCAEAMSGLALLLMETGRFEESEELFADVLQARGAPAQVPPQFARLFSSAAAVLALFSPSGLERAHQITICCPLLNGLLEFLPPQMTDGETDPEHVTTAITAGANHGVLLLKRGKPAAAAAQCAETLAQAERILGPAHAVILQIKESLARAKADCGLSAEAEDGIRDVLCARAQGALTAEEIGAPLAQVPAKLLLVRVLQLRGRFEEADDLVLEVLALLREAKGGASEEALEAKAQLGDLLCDRGQHAEAVRLLSKVVAAWKRLAPGGERRLTTTGPHAALHALARAHHERGNFAEADRCYREVRAGRTADLGADHPFVKLVAADIGRLLVDAGQAGEGRDVLEGAIGGLVEAYGQKRHEARFLLPAAC